MIRPILALMLALLLAAPATPAVPIDPDDLDLGLLTPREGHDLDTAELPTSNQSSLEESLAQTGYALDFSDLATSLEHLRMNEVRSLLENLDMGLLGAAPGLPEPFKDRLALGPDLSMDTLPGSPFALELPDFQALDKDLLLTGVRTSNFSLELQPLELDVPDFNLNGRPRLPFDLEL